MRFLRAIPAGIYAAVLRIRHWFYDRGLIRSYRADVPVVCVGNITVGGTGKTPTVEFLTDSMRGDFRVAVLSRGYGRRTKGYREVETGSAYTDVGDEPLQIKKKFPDVPVVVCEDRTEGIKRLRREHPQVNLIIMDDGFQHRRVTPKVNIVLVDYTRPIDKDHLLPWGNLRDVRSQMRRADIVLVTKAPKTLTPIERRLMGKYLKLYPYQGLFISWMEQGAPRPLFPDEGSLQPAGRDIVALSGIANPGVLTAQLAAEYNILEVLDFPDHHAYKAKDIQKLEEAMAGYPQGTIIVTTDKDAVKLSAGDTLPASLRGRIYTVPVRLAFHGDDKDKFLKRLYKDVRQN